MLVMQSVLVLNSCAFESPRDGIGWRCTRDEHQARGLDRLAAGRWRLGRLRREYDLTGHYAYSDGVVND